MLINFTNHPSNNWSEEQLDAAKVIGEIIDIPFPEIDAYADESYLNNLVKEYADKIKTLNSGKTTTVHIMGELTFTFAMVSVLQRMGIRCIASTAERSVTEIEPGKKQVDFKFVRFRAYPEI